MSTHSEPRKPDSYAPPALTVLGKAHTLTQGPHDGHRADGLFPLHHSATDPHP
jgi:hypothetical protein